MAVTIEKRPIGVTLGSAVSATINSDYSSAFATVNKTAHGLSDGNYVYIKSNIENYNGFFRIEVINSDEFLLIDNPYVYWVGDTDATYYPGTSTHGWSCVHLPIVYELKNTRYPINTVDTVRTISSLSNSNGYLTLSVSGSLGTFEDLAFVKISNAPNSDFNGVYQILDKLSTTSVILNFAYATATNTGLIGASIQLYYSNYNAVVRIYAGINSAHEHASVKPYELAATLELIPDSNNQCRFSVNEILKSYVETKNNLLKSTLPNNTDFWTNFYIEVAEQYDLSNGYTIGTFVSGFFSDQATFEGTAASAMLPFKNVHSGYLSDYVMNNATAKFLTVFAIPVLFGCADDAPDCYQDISFIIDTHSNIELINESFDLSIAPWEQWQRLSGSSEFVYTMGNAVALGPFGGAEATTRAITQERVINNNFNLGYPPGDYAVRIIAENLSVGGSSPFVQQLNIYGSNSLTTGSGDIISYSPNATWEAGAGESEFTVYFTLTSYYQYIGYEFSKQGPSTGYALNFILKSIELISYPLYDNYDIVIKKTYSDLIEEESISSQIGIIRYQLFGNCIYQHVQLQLFVNNVSASETKTFAIDCGCADQELRLTWLNNLGGFEYFNFKAQNEHGIEIIDSGETNVNTFQTWPVSYGEFADTERKQTYRESRKQEFVFSQLLTKEEAEGLSSIKTSPLVQIINSRQDRRTIIVDTDSYVKYVDGDKLYRVQFNFTYTDNLPSQTA